MINFYFNIRHGTRATSHDLLGLDRPGQVHGHSLALALHHDRLKLHIEGSLVGSHTPHDGVYDEPRLKRGAGKAWQGIVGFQKAIAKILHLAPKSFNIIALHGHSILSGGGLVKLNRYMKSFKEFLKEEDSGVKPGEELPPASQYANQWSEAMRRVNFERDVMGTQNRPDVFKEYGQKAKQIRWEREQRHPTDAAIQAVAKTIEEPADSLDKKITKPYNYVLNLLGSPVQIPYGTFTANAPKKIDVLKDKNPTDRFPDPKEMAKRPDTKYMAK